MANQECVEPLVKKFKTEKEPFFTGKKLSCKNRLILGQSWCGFLYCGYWRDNDQEKEVVVRRIQRMNCRENSEIILERHLANSLNHKNVLNIIGYEDSIIYRWRYFALERFDATLEQYCNREYTEPMSCKANVLCQLSEGVNFLHENGISHGNLNPRTILIFRSVPVIVKVSEFGFYGESTGVDESQCHPKYWMLPHSWSTDLDQDGKVLIKPIVTVYGDVFAAGCLFFYFLKRGMHPFGDMESILKNIEEKNPVNLQRLYEGHFAYRLIKEMIGEPPKNGAQFLRIAARHFKDVKSPEIAALERLCGELKAEKEKSTQTQIAMVTAFSNLQRSFESSKSELLQIQTNLKNDLDVERQKAAENALTLQDALLDRNKAEEQAESFRQKLLAMKDEQVSQQTLHKNEKIKLEKQLLECDSALKSSNEKLDEIQAKLHKEKDTITHLRQELDAEKKQVSELVISLRQVTKEKNDVDERAESFQKKLSIMDNEAESFNKKNQEKKEVLTKELMDRFETIRLSNENLKQVHTASIASLETIITNLKSELEVEKQRTSAKAISVETLTLARIEAKYLAESLQNKRKLLDLETEVKNLTKSNENLSAEEKQAKRLLADNHQLFEKEKQTLLRNLMVMTSRNSRLTLEMQELSSSHSKLKEECDSVKKEKLQIIAQLEEVQRELQSLRRNKVDPPVIELSDSDEDV